MAQERRPDPEALLLCESNKRGVQIRYGLRDIVLPVETALEAAIRHDILDDLESGLRDFASLMCMPPEQVGLRGRIAILVLTEPPDDDLSPAQGPTLEVEFDSYPLIRLVDDDEARLCERFAHQWAQALLMEVGRDTGEVGRELCESLVDALLHGPPGGPRELTRHCRNILDAIGLPVPAGEAPVPRHVVTALTGSSFEAFLESESVRVDGDTAERLWRCSPRRDKGARRIQALYGWPDGIERDRAVGYWHMLRGALVWSRNGLTVQEGAEAVARSELERHRRQRHNLDTEKLFAALTLQSLDEDREDNVWPILVARHGHVSAQIVTGDPPQWHREEALRVFPAEEHPPILTRRISLEIKQAVAGCAIETASGADIRGAVVRLERWRGANAADMFTRWITRPGSRAVSLPDTPDRLLTVVVHASEDTPSGCVLRVGFLKEVFELMSEDIVRRLGVAAILGDSDGKATVTWHHDLASRHWTVDIAFLDVDRQDMPALSPVCATDYRVLLGFRPPDTPPVPAQEMK